VWRDGKCVASLAHAGSVWDVTALPNGDIATACSDCIGEVIQGYLAYKKQPTSLGPRPPRQPPAPTASVPPPAPTSGDTTPCKVALAILHGVVSLGIQPRVG